jgi:hypothetical protein
MGHEQLAVLVVIESPLIAPAGGKNLELMADGVIPPDTRPQFGPFIVWGSGLSNAGVIEHTLVSIEPAIRSPQKAVQAFVRILVAKAVQ